MSSFTDMAVGASLSPDSAEVRFCNSDCSEYYSLVFGAKSVFRVDQPFVSGAGSTKPIIKRTSATSWSITFPARTIGRLWKGSGGSELTDVGLYYYEGSLQIARQ